MSYDALRAGRWSQPSRIYVVTTVTRSRKPIFRNFQASRLLIRELMELHESALVNSLAWVVMPDHMHWMFELGGRASLSNVMKSLKARSAYEVNRCLGWRGPIWQPAYYDRAVRKGEEVRDLARYIVANPLRAGLVRAIGEYPHWDCVWIEGNGVVGLD